jgi:FKBP-type peptidyl-prolyl cis-trans isomerase
MKLIAKFSAGLASLGLLIAAFADDAVKFNVPGVTPAGTPAAQPATPAAAPATAAAPAAPARKYTEAEIVEAYGWFVGAQMGLRQLDFTKDQIDALARGLHGVAAGGQPPFDAKEIGPQVDAFMAKKNEVFMGKLKAQQTAMSLEYFTKLKENKAVIEMPDGLRYEVIKAGTGPVPKPGQVVTINYTGMLLSGQVFDSSAERGPAPILLATPSAQNPNGVIPGMFEGLQKTGVGGKLRLHIPPHLAYGDEGAPGTIPPSATLVFEVEIVDVKDAPPAPAAPAK